MCELCRICFEIFLKYCSKQILASKKKNKKKTYIFGWQYSSSISNPPLHPLTKVFFIYFVTKVDPFL